MDLQVAKKPRMMIRVTREEFEQFAHDDTHMPGCATLDANGMPKCDCSCSRELVCAMFTFDDVENGVTIEWYACAPADELARLADRAVPIDETTRQNRRIKYIAYCR